MSRPFLESPTFVDPEADPSDRARRPGISMWKLLTVAVIVVGGALGAAHLQRSMHDRTERVDAPTMNAARDDARRTGRRLLVHFTDDACPPCRRMDEETWSSPQVLAMVERRFVLLRLQPWMPEHDRHAAAFGGAAPPTTVIATAAGDPMMDRSGRPRRHEGFLDAAAMLEFLDEPADEDHTPARRGARTVRARLE